MVILFTANNYLKKGEIFYGGFLVYLHRVTTSLVKLGHTPIVVACGKDSRHYMQDGVEVYIVRCALKEIPIKGIKIGYEMYYRSRIINKKIKEIIQKRPIDIIQFTSLQGLAVCYHGNIPAVLRLSDYEKVFYIACKHRGRIESEVTAFVERRAAAHCNAVFAPGKMVANVFSKDISRAVSVIESPFINDVTKYDMSVYLKYLKNKKYVLFFGTLSIVKGILVISEILYEFLRIHPEYDFVCCGNSKVIDGKNSVKILKNAAGEFGNRCIYIPPLAHEQLYPIIQNANFVVLPSLAENLSNACIEAMYFERVVIGTDGVSYEQLIDDGVSGFLCRPNDGKSLLEKMNEAAVMDEARKKVMGKLARKRIDRLRPEVAVGRLLRYYQYVIDSIENND